MKTEVIKEHYISKELKKYKPKTKTNHNKN